MTKLNEQRYFTPDSFHNMIGNMYWQNPQLSAEWYSWLRTWSLPTVRLPVTLTKNVLNGTCGLFNFVLGIIQWVQGNNSRAVLLLRLATSVSQLLRNQPRYPRRK